MAVTRRRAAKRRLEQLVITASFCGENLSRKLDFGASNCTRSRKNRVSSALSISGMMRSILERAFRDVSFRRRLPAGIGGASLYVSGSAGLKYMFRSMESIDPVLCRMAVELVHPHDVVWDVGANVGLFTFAAAHRAGSTGQVYAFEADSWLVRLLRRSAAIQPEESAPVSIVQTAVANSCDIRNFNIARRSRASNSLAEFGHSQTGGIEEKQKVISVSLDWLAARLPTPDVLKIDVEGAEFEVLTGAKQLLRDKKPIILCEVCAEASGDVSELLGSIGYRMYDAEAAPEQRVAVARACWNTLAVVP